MSRRLLRPVQTPQPRLVPPPTNPMAVARELVHARFRTDAGLVLHDHRGNFYRWNGTCWPEVDRRDIRREVYRWLEHAAYLHDKHGHVPFEPTVRKVNDVVDALCACVGLPSAEEPPMWTTDSTDLPNAHAIVAVANGLLDLSTRTLLPHTPTFFGHHALAFPYDAQAPAPTQWLAFLKELWPDDDSSIEGLQEAFGYVLGGGTAQQKILLLVGPKRGGKGTIGRVLTGLLGKHHVAAPTLASLATNFGLSPLIGKPLALVSDARLSTKVDSKIVVERLLSVSGEDALTVDRKFRDPWTGRLPTRFMILTNELPRLSDASGALASRFVLFVLRRSFYGMENPALTDELLTEAPSIFNWALDGLDRLTERGHFVMPASGQDAIRQLEDLASPIGAFMRDRCVVQPDADVPVDDLWRAWRAWCEANNQASATKAIFGRDLFAAQPSLKRTYPTESDGRRRYHYIGVALAHPAHDSAAEEPCAGCASTNPLQPLQEQEPFRFDPKEAFGRRDDA